MVRVAQSINSRCGKTKQKIIAVGTGVVSLRGSASSPAVLAALAFSAHHLLRSLEEVLFLAVIIC